MKTSEAQILIRSMVKDGKLSYCKEKGLTLTEKATGISLETLCELSTEQVSRIGQEFDPLFPTRKRIKSLTNSGVSVDTLRAMLDELEGKKPGTPKEETLPPLEITDTRKPEWKAAEARFAEIQGGLKGEMDGFTRNALLLEQANLIAALETFQAEYDTERDAEGAKDAEDNQGQLLLSGEEAEPGTDRGIPTEGHTTTNPEGESGTNGTDDNIQQSVNGGDNPGTSGRSRQRRGGGN